MTIAVSFFCRKATIRTLGEGLQDDKHNEAIDHQRKFLYLPLYLFRTETNINELVVKFEKNQKSVMDREALNARITQIHSELVYLDSWPIYLNKLRYICDEKAKSVEKNISAPVAGPSTSYEQKERSENKQKVIYSFSCVNIDFF